MRKRELKKSKKSKSKKLDTFEVTLYKDFDDGDMEDDVGKVLIEFDDHDSDTFDLSYYIGVSILQLESLRLLLIIDSNYNCNN